jgi:serine/threonine protein phosphatase PrpC
LRWKAVARSVIGVSHEKHHIPCQDFAAYRILPPSLIIGAVADGAGAAKYAHRGAQLAVEISLEYLTRLAKYYQNKRAMTDSLWLPFSFTQAERIFSKMVKKIRATLSQEAANENYALKDLASTLLVFVAHPQWLMGMQIGDGFILVRPSGGSYQLLFSPDKGEFINETTFITSENALEQMQVTVRSEAPKFICASTDALEKVAIKMANWTPFPPFFQPLEEYLEETWNPEIEDGYLQQFLNSERLNARTDDDKTLLLCLLSEDLKLWPPLLKP